MIVRRRLKDQGRLVGDWLATGWRLVGNWSGTCLRLVGDHPRIPIPDLKCYVKFTTPPSCICKLVIVMDYITVLSETKWL